jgi:GTPase SAR1 family protein
VTASLYLLGAPGVGKSTVMKALLSDWDAEERPERIEGQLRGHVLSRGRYETWMTGLYLGILREEFPGTDGLGMAVMPDALRWVLTRELPDVILGEGARLGTTKFLTALSCWTRLTVVLLDAPDDVLDARRRERGSDQDPTWLQGAATRARNAAAGAEAAGVQVVRVDASAPLEEVVETVQLLAP